MDRTADILLRGHHLEQFIAHILRVRRCKADTQQGRDVGHTAHQLRKIDLTPAVGVHVLTQERHLAVAILEKGASLCYDRLCIATALTTARVGHHAVGAEVVATAHDRDKATHTVLVDAHRCNLAVGLFRGEEDIDALRTRLGSLQQIRKVAIGIRTGHYIDTRLGLQERLVQTLGHATHDAHHKARLLLLQATHLGETSPDALLGIVANRTGVDQNHIGLGLRLGVAVAVLLENRDDNLRIAHIHLTAVGLDKELATLTHQRTQCIYRFKIQNYKFKIKRLKTTRF